jgi:hypothetical protein
MVSITLHRCPRRHTGLETFTKTFVFCYFLRDPRIRSASTAVAEEGVIAYRSVSLDGLQLCRFKLRRWRLIRRRRAGFGLGFRRRGRLLFRHCEWFRDDGGIGIGMVISRSEIWWPCMWSTRSVQ